MPTSKKTTGASVQVSSSKKEKDPCWDGYHQIGTKQKKGKKVPNCVPEEEGKKAKK